MTRTIDETAHALYSQLIGWPGQRVLGVELSEMLQLVVCAMKTCPFCHGPVGDASNHCRRCDNLSSWRTLGETK